MSDYTFNFDAGGAIVSYQERQTSGKARKERIDRDEKAYLQNGMIVIEEYDDGVLEWDVFRDANGDGVWQKAASGETAEALQSILGQLTQLPVVELGFTLESGREDTAFRFNAAGQVTHEGELERNGKIDWDGVDKDDTYQVRGTFVLEQDFKRGAAQEWTLFSDADSDGLWTEIASGYGVVDFSALLEQLPASHSTFA